MQFNLVWSEPIILADATAQGLIYLVPSANVPAKAGIYVFGRRHGKTLEALYVGKANNLQLRVQQQMIKPEVDAPSAKSEDWSENPPLRSSQD